MKRHRKFGKPLRPAQWQLDEVLAILSRPNAHELSIADIARRVPGVTAYFVQQVRALVASEQAKLNDPEVPMSVIVEAIRKYAAPQASKGDGRRR